MITLLRILLLAAQTIGTFGNENSTESTEPIPAKFREICQFLEDPITVGEGTLGLTDTSHKYKLRGVVVVTRHGERSPLSSKDTYGGVTCEPYRTEDRIAFNDYQKLVNSDDFKKYLHVDENLKNFKWHPQPSDCESGQLTAEGALQLSKLGRTLAGQYWNSSLFDKGQTLSVKVMASNYPRTLQSAIAFTSEFLYPLRTFIPKVNVSFSPSMFMCNEEWCDCPQLTQSWLQQSDAELEEYFKTKSSEKVRNDSKIFKEIQVTQNMDDPYSFLDTMLGLYVCRRQPLPCTTSSGCVNYDILDEMYAEEADRSKKTFLAEAEYNMSKIVLVIAHAILGNVLRAADELVQIKNRTVFQLYSGHDYTLAPLLRALQISFPGNPHYAARVTFEIYEKENMSVDNNQKLFFRILYDGADKTNELPFCIRREDGLCAVTDLSAYLQTGMWTLSKKYTSLRQTCPLSEPGINSTVSTTTDKDDNSVAVFSYFKIFIYIQIIVMWRLV